jgi:hypothetical protein
MNGLIIKRLKFKDADIREFLYNESLFKKDDPKSLLDFETFKKAFFPQLFHIQEEDLSDQE